MKKTIIRYLLSVTCICTSLFLFACDDERTEASVPEVLESELDSLSLSPARFSLMIGESETISVRGYYTDGSTKEITENVSFTSSNNVAVDVDINVDVDVDVDVAGPAPNLTLLAFPVDPNCIVSSIGCANHYRSHNIAT